jgi:signal transduction histidine kinase
MVAINELIVKVVEQRNIVKPKIDFITQVECLLSVDEETLYSVLNHLLQNAQEATKDEGWVKLTLLEDDIDIIIEIEDSGTGMSEEFIKHRLFKPFDTTKGNAGMGIGVFEAKQFFEGNAGVLNVVSIEEQGTKFTMKLPKSRSF